MSIIDEHIRRFDTYLDRCQLLLAPLQKSSAAEGQPVEPTAASEHDTIRTSTLKNVIRSLSVTSSTKPLLKRRRLRNLIADLDKLKDEAQASNLDNEEDLEWLAAGKATVQLYGITLRTLLDQTIPLGESMWYWDDVLGSYVGTSLYMLQTSPVRLMNAGKEIWRDANERYQSKLSIRDAAEQSTQSLSEGWREFYELVRGSIRDRSLTQARTKILTPFALARTEARQKQDQLKKLREQSATAIGMLVDMGLSIPQEDHYEKFSAQMWRTSILRSMALVEGLLNHGHNIEGTITDYENDVYEVLDAAEQTEYQPSHLTRRMLHILDKHLPEQEHSSDKMALEFGKPPRWVRYWIPGVVLFLSGGTLLRIFANRRAEILEWFRDLGQTTIDFWYNWVVEPTKRLVSTIRHDDNSEVALMSRDSLQSDRDSLERMVVDFAAEHPEGGKPYTEAQLADIRTKVREGDLTPIMRAYEQEMKSPVVRAVTGNLIQALLIQIQKTKVDVEVAVGGIDSILKSQELLFGFVGVAPGILVSYFAFRWIQGFFGGRRGLQQLRQKGESVRLLRNIERLLNSDPTPEGLLTYKNHGLLICEVQILQQRGAGALPGRIQREFLEDLNDLINVRDGIEKQRRVLQRIQWGYSKWLK